MGKLFWSRAIRRANNETLHFIGFDSLRRFIRSTILVAIAIVVVKYIGSSEQMSEELLWIIAIFTAAGIIYIPMFIWNLIKAPGRMEALLMQETQTRETTLKERVGLLDEELKAIKNARPNIVFAGIENVITPIKNPKTGIVFGEPCFTQVLFANESKTSPQKVDAINVVGNIDIYHQDGQHLFNMIGRWAETKEGATGGLPTEMEQIPIPANGRPCPLDIALKYREDENAYGQNNKSRRLAPPYWRYEDWRLVVGIYFVRVQLSGSNIDDKVFWFELTNKGAGADIELNVAVNPPSISDKEDFQT